MIPQVTDMAKYEIVPPLKGSVLTIQTDRLYLSVCKPSWGKAVTDYLQRNRKFHKPFQQVHPNIYYTVSEQREYIRSDLKQYERNTQYGFWITKIDDPYRIIGRISFYSIIGGCMNTCFVGYHLDEKEMGHGYMTESLEVGCDFMFKYVHLHRIQADVMPTNTRSLACVKRCGFEEMGYNKNYMEIDGSYKDHVMFAKLNPNEENVT